MQELLRRFNDDTHTKDALRVFLDEFIGKEGVRRIFARENVDAVADAKILIDKAFEALSDEYGIKLKQETPQNESR